MAYSQTAVGAQTEAYRPREARQEKNSDRPESGTGNETFTDHVRTYRGFVRGVTIFAAHALAILILLHYFLM